MVTPRPPMQRGSAYPGMRRLSGTTRWVNRKTSYVGRREAIAFRRSPTLSRGAAEGLDELTVGKHAYGVLLHLPDPLARDVQLLAELRERGRLPVVEAITPHQHVACPLRQPIYSLLELDGLHLPHHRVGGVGDPLVLDEVPELR